VAAGRLVLMATSHRVAPGLLTADAWDLLRRGRVMATAGHRLLPALHEQGISVTVRKPEPPAQRVPALLEAVTTDGSQSVPTVWLQSDDGDPGLAAALAAALAVDPSGAPDGLAERPELEVLHASYDVPGARLLDLVTVMDRLRSPGGCPWDAEQTHRSLSPYLLEETYETLEAIESDDADALREELGDVLLQVVFHARLGEESRDRAWSIDDVAAQVVDKLISRHPHVFAGATVDDAAHVEANWQRLKAAEKGRTSVLDGVPAALPALALADKYLGRASNGGVDVEVDEPELPLDLTSEQLGALLLGIVFAARRRGLDAEAALRESARHFAGLVRLAEAKQRSATLPDG
jgi:XTP/dITP diphosphohydrolase